MLNSVRTKCTQKHFDARGMRLEYKIMHTEQSNGLYKSPAVCLYNKELLVAWLVG
jgi:hypothetical protein